MDSVATTNPVETMKPRKLWIIVVLALLTGPFMLVYCGRLRRAIVWQIAYLGLGFTILGIILYYPVGGAFLVLAVVIVLGNFLALVIHGHQVARRVTDEPPKSYQRWWVYFGILFAFVVCQNLAAVGIRDFVCEAFVLPTGSMKSTLLPGDRFCVFKIGFIPRRGQVVAFREPEKKALIYVKRIVGLGGDEVRIEADQVFVNDTPLEEPYVTFIEPLPQVANLRDFGPVQVPAGHVFVLGDNRWSSLDSRLFGLIPMENLIGEVRGIFWSREYEYKPPTREAPGGEEVWGDLRWERIGMWVE